VDSRSRGFGVRAAAALAVLLCSLSAAPSASAKFTRAFKGIRYAKVSRVCPGPKPGQATCFALARVSVPATDADEPGVRPYKAAAGALESGPGGTGLTPADLASAYGYDPSAGGSGQTIAIVDAYDDPNIEGDLATFDSEYGIAACTTANGCFTKVSQTGSTTSLPEADRTGWSVEIALDVETAHSTCPNCKILLVEAESESFKNLAAAVQEAVALGATEVSNSYGGPEAESGEIEKSAYSHPGVVIAAATGDWGYDNWAVLNKGKKPPGAPNLPATLPTVVAVGGTTLELNEEAKRENETVWNGNGPVNDSEFVEGATGGGCSTLFAAESWQQATPGYAAAGCGGKRLAADVSADANPYSGIEIYDTYNCGEECETYGGGQGWLTIGGTSLSTPLISALYALAGGSSGVSYPALTLYGHLGDSSSLYDVTEGGNGYCDAAPEFECGHPDAFGAVVSGYALQLDCEYTTACNAAPGFDGPSGVGTPNGLSLFKSKLPTAAVTPPGSLRAGATALFTATASSDPYPGGSIASYAWNWGDGTHGSGAAPTHLYSGPGEYTVTLMVTDSYGLTSLPVTLSVRVGEGEAEVNKRHEEEATAARKREEEAAAKSSVNAGQGVNGFRVSIAPAVPDAKLASTSLQVTLLGAVTLKISCPTGETTCSGTISLRTLAAVIAGDGYAARQKPSVLTLARGSFTVAGGKLVSVTLHLSTKARMLLARRHTLRARATLLARDPQGASHTTLTIVTLRAAKASHHTG
jgi:PKD repeat protein